jgi:hypothetical protein
MRFMLNAGLVGAAFLAAACATTGASTSPALTADLEAPVASADPRVKYKDGERYLRDLSESLAMPRETICKELGRYDCFTDAFRIVLGGVEGPNLLVNQPLEVEALTSPIAYDRVALNVCASRVSLDAAEPAAAVLFKPSGKPGRKPGKAWLNSTADGIYAGVLRRDPTPAERSQLVAFYDEVAKTGAGGNPAKDWTILGCFAVATSLEALFY